MGVSPSLSTTRHDTGIIADPKQLDLSYRNKLVFPRLDPLRLVSLNLRATNIGEAKITSFKPLLDYLRITSSLSDLNLSCNNMGAVTAAPIFKNFMLALPYNRSLRSLNLSANRFSLTHTVLISGIFGAGYMMDGLKQRNRSITLLDLTDNMIAEEGVLRLRTMMASNWSLTHLLLSGTGCDFDRPVGGAALQLIEYACQRNATNAILALIVGSSLSRSDMWEPRLSTVIAEYCFEVSTRNEDFIMAEAYEMSRNKGHEPPPPGWLDPTHGLY